MISNFRHRDSTAFVHERFARTDVVHVIGEVDLASAPDLEAACLASARLRHELVLDFSRCTYIDSSVLAVAVRMHRSHAPLFSVVVDAKGVVKRILAISGLDTLFTCREESLAAVTA